MSKKQALVPRLRFPEFRDAGEWNIAPLNKLANRRTERSRDGKLTRVLTNSAEYGVVDQRDYFDKDIAAQGNLENYFIVEWDDFVYNPRISAFAPVGPISRNRVETGVMSPLYTVFQFKDSNTDFYEHYFKSSAWHGYMQRVGNTGARHDRMAISNKDFIAMPIPVTSKKEQQKIADCLSSLDVLIAAQADKIDTLKAHKKGLMQQLFPREGERVPQLRFPEFQDAGEWKETKLGDNLSKPPEYGLNAPSVPYADNLPTYLRITDISDDGCIRQDQKVSVDKNVTDENYLKNGDIVLARTGASVGKSYKYRTQDGRLVFAGFLIRIRPDKKTLNPDLLFQFLSTERYWRWVALTSTRSGQPGINSNEYATLPIPLPPSSIEQQKIAGCLSSLDALIIAHSEKVDTLKAHKKGLMQQLFPYTRAA